MPKLQFDYTEAKKTCDQLGLVWLGEDFVRAADEEAWVLGFTQEQVDSAMKHHLVQVNWLFTPTSYNWYQRLLIAFYFITGWRPK